jgi:hypothetical protein
MQSVYTHPVIKSLIGFYCKTTATRSPEVGAMLHAFDCRSTDARSLLLGGTTAFLLRVLRRIERKMAWSLSGESGNATRLWG